MGAIKLDDIKQGQQEIARSIHDYLKLGTFKSQIQYQEALDMMALKAIFGTSFKRGS